MAWRGTLGSHPFLSLSVLSGHCEVSSVILLRAFCRGVLMLYDSSSDNGASDHGPKRLTPEAK